MKASNKTFIQVAIINDSRQEECEAECGMDWSTPEAFALASERIKDRFGDEVKLTYLDLAKAEADEDTQQWTEVIRNQNLLLPVLLVNGQLRVSGQFDIRQLIDIIEVEMELRG